jgi:DNA replication protein DnaC
VSGEWPALAQPAAADEARYADFLEKLLSAEAGARVERTRQTLLKLATRPAVKTIEQYDCAFASGAPSLLLISCCSSQRPWRKCDPR